MNSIKFIKIIGVNSMCKYDKIKLDNQLCFSLYAVSREIIKLYKPLLDKHKDSYSRANRKE